MTDTKKIQILENTIDRLQEENEMLIKENSLLRENIEFTKKERKIISYYIELCKILKLKRREYDEINRQILKCKKEYEKKLDKLFKSGGGG